MAPETLTFLTLIVKVIGLWALAHILDRIFDHVDPRRCDACRNGGPIRSFKAHDQHEVSK